MCLNLHEKSKTFIIWEGWNDLENSMLEIDDILANF